MGQPVGRGERVHDALPGLADEAVAPEEGELAVRHGGDVHVPDAGVGEDRKADAALDRCVGVEEGDLSVVAAVDDGVRVWQPAHAGTAADERRHGREDGLAGAGIPDVQPPACADAASRVPSSEKLTLP